MKPFKSKSFCGSENISSNYHIDKAQNHYHTNNFETVQQRYRSKRAIDPAKVVCELYMQADHRYYQQFYSNTETVIEQIINHVAAMNVIFGAVGKLSNVIEQTIKLSNVIEKIHVAAMHIICWSYTVLHLE